MSEQVIFKLNGSECQPEDATNLELEISYDKDLTEARQRITNGDFTFVREDKDVIDTHIQAGMAGTGPGFGQGLSLTVDVVNGTQSSTVLKGLIDIRKAVFSEVRIKCPVIEEKNIDWLNGEADSFTFEYLYKKTGEISSSDFVPIPYILNSIPDYKQSAIALLTSAFVLRELLKETQQLISLAVEMANVFEASALIRFALELTYDIALFVSLANTIKECILFIIQPVKYHMGMTVQRLFEVGCSHLGMVFKNKISQNDANWLKEVIIPEKFSMTANPTEPRIFNFTTPAPTQQDGYYKGTFGDFIRAMKTKFAAKIRIIKNVSTGTRELWLLREDDSVNAPQYTLPPIYSPSQYGEEWTYNLDEFISNDYIRFETDVTDKNTIQNYSGVAYQAYLKGAMTTNSDLILSGGFRQTIIPFARVTRKESLTVPEQICNTLINAFNSLVNGLITAVNACISVFNSIIGVINSVANALSVFGINVNWHINPIPSINSLQLNNLISNRIGMMMIENDDFQVAKIGLFDIAQNPKNTKVSALNSTYESAEYHYKSFHIIRSYQISTALPYGNQRKLIRVNNVPFSRADYLLVKENEFCNDWNGNKCEIVNIKWRQKKQQADFYLRVPTLVIKSLILEEIIPDGK